MRHCAATSHCPGHSLSSALMSSLCGWLGETNPSLVQGGNMKAALCSPYPSLTGNQLSIVSSDNTGNSPTHSAWCRSIFHQNLRCNIVNMMNIMQIGLCAVNIVNHIFHLDDAHRMLISRFPHCPKRFPFPCRLIPFQNLVTSVTIAASAYN